MKITGLLKNRKKPTVSFEFYPAKNDKQSETLDKTLKELLPLKPDFVSVTFGAGGSTRQGSYDLAQRLKKQEGMEVIAYFAGFGLGPQEISMALDRYRDAGIENILAVRGDKPHDMENFTPHPESFHFASEILGFIRPRYNLCIGVAGYPEGHIECESREKDMEYLKRKIDLGAEYIITNYSYDNRFYFDFMDRCLSHNINVPVIPGVMPMFSVKMMHMLAELCGATITENLKKGIDSLPPDNREELIRFGIRFATEQCSELLKQGVQGLHFYTLNRSESCLGILQNLRNEKLI